MLSYPVCWFKTQTQILLHINVKTYMKNSQFALSHRLVVSTESWKTKDETMDNTVGCLLFRTEGAHAPPHLLGTFPDSKFTGILWYVTIHDTQDASEKAVGAGSTCVISVTNIFALVSTMQVMSRVASSWICMAANGWCEEHLLPDFLRSQRLDSDHIL